ncbi:MAG: hypothetical protein M3Y74_22930 [Chloroflexota bacterium]|nr:hypothetical protein [Chloroflexota bacterium]
METSRANTHAHQDGWRIVIAGEADVAISQLKANDKQAIAHRIARLQEEGPSLLTRLNTADSLYVLHVPAAPDVRVVVRLGDDSTIEVTDVVRAVTLRNIFAHAS